MVGIKSAIPRYQVAFDLLGRTNKKTEHNNKKRRFKEVAKVK